MSTLTESLPSRSGWQPWETRTTPAGMNVPNPATDYVAFPTETKDSFGFPWQPEIGVRGPITESVWGGRLPEAGKFYLVNRESPLVRVDGTDLYDDPAAAMEAAERLNNA
jgi:hypothetical protein